MLTAAVAHVKMRLHRIQTPFQRSHIGMTHAEIAVQINEFLGLGPNDQKTRFIF